MPVRVTLLLKISLNSKTIDWWASRMCVYLKMGCQFSDWSGGATMVHTMQCNAMDLNKVYLSAVSCTNELQHNALIWWSSAVWQELLPKSGIDGSYRCSISPYLRPISFEPTIPSIRLSLLGLWFNHQKSKVKHCVVMYSVQNSQDFGEKFSTVWVWRGWCSILGATVHMTSDTLVSDVRYEIYVFPECFFDVWGENLDIS